MRKLALMFTKGNKMQKSYYLEYENIYQNLFKTYTISILVKGSFMEIRKNLFTTGVHLPLMDISLFCLFFRFKELY